MRRVIDLISMTRKAGQAVAGFEKVKDLAYVREAGRCLLQATDGSERGAIPAIEPPPGKDSFFGWS